MSLLQQLRDNSQAHLNDLQTKMNEIFSSENDFYKDVCVYACGSLARLEMTQTSDLDLFFIVTKDGATKDNICTNLDRYLFFGNLYSINKEFRYQDPSKQGYFWEFIAKSDLLDVGSSKEDYNNSFTARMLMILESKPIYNQNAYLGLVKDVVDVYFKDYDDHKSQFYPLFLMNDILRYWYTLTLNYEYKRDPNDDENKKNWRRLKLKYARLITCFSMIACLYKDNISRGDVYRFIAMTPFERINMIAVENKDVRTTVDYIKAEYEWFLSLKNEGPEWWNIGEHKMLAISRAENFHDCVIHDFMRTVSEGNLVLRKKTDVY